VKILQNIIRNTAVMLHNVSVIKSSANYGWRVHGKLAALQG